MGRNIQSITPVFTEISRKPGLKDGIHYNSRSEENEAREMRGIARPPDIPTVRIADFHGGLPVGQVLACIS